MPLASFAMGLVLAANISGGPAKPSAQQHINQNQAVPKVVMITVNQGDTLEGIAQANQTTYVRLYEANQIISDPNIIYPGERLRVPAPDEALASRPLPPAPVASALVDSYAS